MLYHMSRRALTNRTVQQVSNRLSSFVALQNVVGGRGLPILYGWLRNKSKCIVVETHQPRYPIGQFHNLPFSDDAGGGDRVGC